MIQIADQIIRVILLCGFKMKTKHRQAFSFFYHRPGADKRFIEVVAFAGFTDKFSRKQNVPRAGSIGYTGPIPLQNGNSLTGLRDVS